MIIAHLHRAIYGGSYTEILKALCTKINIPYVSPLEEQCHEVQGSIASETDCEISTTEDEESNS